MSSHRQTDVVAPAERRLRVRIVESNGSEHRHRFEIETARVVLWERADVEIEIRQSATQGWRFRPQPRMLDRYAAGTYWSYSCTAGARRRLIASMPREPEWPGDGRQVRTCLQYHDRVLERLLRELQRHDAGGEPLGALYSEMLSLAIVEQLQRDGPARADASSPTLAPRSQQSLHELIEHRLDDPPGVEQLAVLAGMGTSRFLVAFRAGFGMPLHQYVLHRRVERAKLLLAGDHASLATLAARLGFANHAHFTTVFRARTGSTPASWRHGSRDRLRNRT